MHLIRARLGRQKSEPPPSVPEPAPELRVEFFRSYAEYNEFRTRTDAEHQNRRDYEGSLAFGREKFITYGYCACCERSRPFRVTSERARQVDKWSIPGYRETLICTTCQLNSRMRSCFGFAANSFGLPSTASVYMPEQVTALYARFKERFPGTIGSEYLGADIAGGTTRNGVRHEDITRLSFTDEQFDLVANFEIMEHVPNYWAGFEELLRVLKKGGRLLMTVPFMAYKQETLVRARLLDNGDIEHLVEPEYHGDPLDPKGTLCYYYYSWDLLGLLEEIGFSRVEVWHYWSREYAYLGHQFALVATR